MPGNHATCQESESGQSICVLRSIRHSVPCQQCQLWRLFQACHVSFGSLARHAIPCVCQNVVKRSTCVSQKQASSQLISGLSHGIRATVSTVSALAAVLAVSCQLWQTCRPCRAEHVSHTDVLCFACRATSEAVSTRFCGTAVLLLCSDRVRTRPRPPCNRTLMAKTCPKANLRF